MTRLSQLRASLEAATPGPWRNIGPLRDGGILFDPPLTDADGEMVAEWRNAAPAILDALEAAREVAETPLGDIPYIEDMNDLRAALAALEREA